jgi:large subunit ribosomal protein L25
MSGTLRKNLGAKDAKALRNQGLVPCVIYGTNEPVHVAIDQRQFSKVVYTPNVYIINLDVEGTNYDVFLKDVQFHPVSDEVLHADFFQPAEGQSFELKIPVTLTGTSPGVLNGGKLRLLYRKLRVKGTVETFPDFIEVSISKLRIGMGVRVSELSVPGIEFLDSPNNYVVSVKTARGAMDDEEEEEDEEGGEGAEGEGTAAEGEAKTEAAAAE